MLTRGRAMGGLGGGAQPPLTSTVENYAKTTTTFFFHFSTVLFKTFGDVQYTIGKVFSRPFKRYITSPQIPKILVGKSKKQICNHLATTVQIGQKNRNGKTTSVIFCNVFYECIEGNSGICLPLAMFIGDD